jgi:hypothetical protein
MLHRAAGLATLLAAVTLLAPSAQSAVLWSGDYETGNFSQWGEGTVQAVPGDATVTPGFARQGRYAARFVVRPGDNPIRSSGERAEVYRSTGETAGTESWWGWSTYFPAAFNPNPDSFWNIFTQWHTTANNGQSNLNFEVNTQTSPWTIQLRTFGGDIDTNQHRFALAALERDRWYDFIVHVRWAPDDSGFVEVWLNGANVLPRTSIPTIYRGLGVYLKQGFYRGASGLTTTLYHDGMRRGDSYDAVTSTHTDAPATPHVRPMLRFLSQPRVLNRRVVIVRGHAPAAHRVHVIVHGPHWRVLGSRWFRTGRGGGFSERVRLRGLHKQRFVRVTLVLPARKAHAHGKSTASVRTTTVSLRRASARH